MCTAEAYFYQHLRSISDLTAIEYECESKQFSLSLYYLIRHTPHDYVVLDSGRVESYSLSLSINSVANSSCTHVVKISFNAKDILAIFLSKKYYIRNRGTKSERK